MTDWAHRIQRLEAAGWSLTDLAQHLGVAVSTLSDIKNGRTLEPKGMSAVRLYQLDLHVHAAAPEPAPSDQQAA
jgi:transcriptional regulator with XRE-family HTH domain